MATAEKPDAVALLKADHRKVEGLFAAFEAAKGDGKKKALAEQICLELTVHTKIEEDIFYPAFREAVTKKDDKEMYFEAREEHHVADMVLRELKGLDPTAETLTFEHLEKGLVS